ncbi:type II toxin-antitoxin system VapC family toxin [Xanthobacter tagetidis]|uniref:PIN domain-containing protein n=1 Tax=Xanthobacter tagetidis TaxID=60216 RepID=A0A3L7A7I9_9HYPH|nr:type II toxin-antitoxin system VapC family toxin [Xanthobacter tagetidis]MBB6308411.1 putative nucleic acid-binding protein [Xanthobacter tagetidis]RLP76273.1 PIN domain-containing protein [Xanthobacter tagetidis]
MAFRIYLDTNVFITALERRGPISELLVSLLLAGWDSVEPPLVTSELTYSELIVKPYQIGRQDLVQLYDNWTTSGRNIEVIPVFRGILYNAAVLRAQDTTLKLPDSIHLATALGLKCSVLLSSDQRIRPQGGIEKLEPTEENVRALLQKVASHDR